MSARNRWTRTEIRITSKLGTMDVPGYVHPDAPGLAVTLGDVECDGYRVTHVASGCSMHRTLVSYPLADAKELALAIARATDCTVPIEAFAKRDTIERVNAATLETLDRLGYTPRVVYLSPQAQASHIRRTAKIVERVLAEGSL